jgi:predicted nucleic acid-binding protein
MKNLIYLDSGILLDCILLQQGYTKVNTEKRFNIKEIDSNKSEFLISNISLIELTEHLKDSKASLCAINNGYSYFDLCKHRIDDIELSQEQLDEIDQIIKDHLIDVPSVVSISPKGFSAKEINNLVEICNQYSIFLIDALHFLIADRENCNIFVTNDQKLKKGLKKLISDLASEHEMRVVASKEFKNNILNTLK